ncbi:hypothetical protein CR969_02740 [Candidatus Saccharibacteria bacterium]|nr:MAG: hypothetical protein CR969_02740 [Candidatus Saccharibacteria bacterium]
MSTWADYGFFIFAGLVSFWLAWLVFREGIDTGGWWMVLIFIVVWAITSYLALPRLHRILTNIYVPNYFIGRTRTADGLLGDPVNLALRGSEAQIHKAMKAAGWSLAEDITPKSTWKMIASTLTRRSYPEAPVSSLLLFGRRQDFAYQQEVEGNPSQRHHVRFWRCPDGWLLPGGHRVEWLAAGTYDKSVGLSLLTFQITHKIDENTDIERDYIIDTVKKATKTVKLDMLKDFSTGYHSRNGGGDSIQTDGNLPILELQKVKAESTKSKQGIQHLILDKTIYDQRPEGYDTLLRDLWSRRPPQILLGFLFLLMLMAVAIIDIVKSLVASGGIEQFINQISAGSDMSRQESLGLLTIIVLISLVAIIIEFILAVAVFRGSNKSRIMLLVLVTITALAEILSFTVNRIDLLAVGLLISIGLNIGVLLTFSSDAARLFTKAHSQKTKA